jgi:O-antigen/teichoic acid export membrane protein
MASAAKNIFWLSFSRALAMILLAVAYIFLFRYLGTFGSGQYQFALSFVTIFGIVIDFGMLQYIIKKMSEDPSRQKFYFHNFIAIEIILVLIVYGALAGVAYFNRYEPAVFHAILIGGLSMIPVGLTYPFLAVMSANGDLKKVALINFINSTINIAFIFSAIVFHKYIVFLIANQVTFGIIGLTLYYHYVQKHIGKPEILSVFSKIDWQVIKKVLLAASPFALLVGFSTIYNRIDTVLIYRTLGADATGLYASAYKFFDLIGFFPSVVSFSLYPIFAGLMANQSHQQVRETLEKYFRFLIAIALPVGVGGSLLAPFLIRVMAGEEFIAAAPTLAILVWAPAILIAYIVVNSLVISQLTKLAVIVTGVNVLVNVIGNIILLPMYGIKAAAVLTIVSELIQAIFYFYFVYSRISRFSIFTYIWRPLLASAIMGIALYALRQTSFLHFSAANAPLLQTFVQLIIAMAIGMGVYAFVLWVMRFYRSEDKAFILGLIKRGA